MLTRIALLLLIALPLSAQTIYVNDFQTGDVAGWTTNVSNATFQRGITITQTPAGSRAFLGDFGNQTISYSAIGIPQHDSISVEFDLFVIRSWDGNATDIDGPDLFIVREGANDVLRTSFSNGSGWSQSYPGAYPNANNAMKSSAVEKNTLGYMEGDAVYRIRVAFAHTGNTVALSFEAALRDRFASLDNESWGIDNIAITAITRRPSSATLIGGDATAAPGEEVLIPIYARDVVELASSGATAIRTRVRFNASMLVPISPTPQGVIEGNDRVIDLTLPLNIAGDSVIDRLNFRVAVGDDTVTAITLESSSPVGGSLALTERAGTFRVRGLCQDGGTRLFRSQVAALLRAPYPNPVRDRAVVEFELVADDHVRIELLDATGAVLSVLVDDSISAGMHTVVIDAQQLPLGRYQLRMLAGFETRMQSLVVVR